MTGDIMNWEGTALVAGVVMALTGCAGATQTQTPRATATATPVTVTGTADVLGHGRFTGPVRIGGICDPSADYSDLTGAQVVIADDAGRTLATSKISSEGKFTVDVTNPSAPANKAWPCSFTFSASNVPSGLAFYTVTIAGHTPQKVSGSEINQQIDLKLQ